MRAGYAAGMLSTITEMNVNVPMTLEEEYALVRRFQAGDEAAGRRLVAAMMCHVFGIAMKLRGYGAPFDDMIADGCHGMVIGLRKFDVSFGVRLVTYVARWISAHIMQNVRRGRRMVRCPGMTSGPKAKVFYGVRRALARLERDGIEPSDIAARLAAEFEVKPEWMASALVYMRSGDESMDYVEDDGSSLSQSLPSDGESPEQALSRLEANEKRRARVARAVQSLDARERLIIRTRVMAEDDEAETLQGLGDRLGISKERVRQLEVKAIGRLRVALRRVEQ